MGLTAILVIFDNRIGTAVPKSFVMMGGFDGPSLFELSAVKHLGKDNNGQFFDTVKWGRGVRVFLVCLFDLTEQPKGRKLSFWDNTGIILLLKSLKSTNTQFEQMESGCVWHFKIKNLFLSY